MDAIGFGCPRLTHLDLSKGLLGMPGNALPGDYSRLADASCARLGEGCKALVLFELEGSTALTDKGLEGILQGATACRRLGLRACELLQDRGVQALAMTCHRLEELDLSFNPRLTDRSLLCLVRGEPVARSLEGFLRVLCRVAREEYGEGCEISYSEMTGMLGGNSETRDFVAYMLDLVVPNPTKGSPAMSRFRRFDVDKGASIGWGELQVAARGFVEHEAAMEIKAIGAVTKRPGSSLIRRLKLGGCPLLSKKAVGEACEAIPLLAMIDLEGSSTSLKASLGDTLKLQDKSTSAAVVARVSHPCLGSWAPEDHSTWAVECPYRAVRHSTEVAASDKKKRADSARIRQEREEERCRKLQLQPRHLENVMEKRREVAATRAFLDAEVAARTIMLLCDRTRRIGTVTETELRVGLALSPYRPLLEYLGLAGEERRVPSRYRKYT